jgi:hypothetical protein
MVVPQQRNMTQVVFTQVIAVAASEVSFLSVLLSFLLFTQRDGVKRTPARHLHLQGD